MNTHCVLHLVDVLAVPESEHIDKMEAEHTTAVGSLTQIAASKTGAAQEGALTADAAVEVPRSSMTDSMQQRAIEVSRFAMRRLGGEEAGGVAEFIQAEHKEVYGGRWRADVGDNFGSSVTCKEGLCNNFDIGPLQILLCQSP